MRERSGASKRGSRGKSTRNSWERSGKLPEMQKNFPRESPVPKSPASRKQYHFHFQKHRMLSLSKSWMRHQRRRLAPRNARLPVRSALNRAYSDFTLAIFCLAYPTIISIFGVYQITTTATIFTTNDFPINTINDSQDGSSSWSSCRYSGK